ncbi:Ig-like domain-containing protein [Paenibacillus sp. FSL W8-0194]|uniref:Ig-like domain-containing protein n=1 Tax=Paenibacillus sp. FSL W8-0194 TaxID=2921711 RepID=UPI0030D9B61D
MQEGDTLTYTVNFKNEGGDETGNTVFTDTIPDGTEYIPGSLEIVSGPNTGKLTDKSGDDQGEFLENEKRVVVRLGNGANQSQAGRIPNTDVLPNGTTVQFKVKILSKYKTTTVANQATVGYDNLLTGTHEERKSNGVTVDVNRPPISPDFEETTWSGINVTGSVYGVDANGDPLTFEKGKDPEKGKVTVGPDGKWEYTPDGVGDFSFTVIVKDSKGGSTTSTVTIHVKEPPNHPPVTENDNVTTEKDKSVTGSVYGTDPDGDELKFAIKTDPKHGKVELKSDGTWEYFPDPGYSGPDIFTVIVDDQKGGVTTSTITVNVTDKPTPPTNRPPTASDKTVTTEKGKSVTDTVYGTDPDGDPLTYTKGKDPEHGTVTVNPDGTWTYTPEPGHVGGDSFTIIVEDSKGGKTTVTITVDVKEPATNPGTNPGTDPGTTPGTDPGTSPGTDSGTSPGTDSGTSPGTTPNPGTDPGKPNQVPSVPSYNAETTINTPATGKIEGTDADGDKLTYTKGSDPKHGSVTVNPDGTWTYVPDRDYTGSDSFTVIVSDGRGGTTTSVVTLDVKGTGTEPGTTVPGTTPEPTKPGTGTTPTNPGSGTPSNPGPGTTPTSPGTGTAPDAGDGSGSPLEDNGTVAGESGKAPSPGEQSGSKLPNTSTNVYNLGFIGMVILLAGLLLFWRKRKV